MGVWDKPSMNACQSFFRQAGFDKVMFLHKDLKSPRSFRGLAEVPTDEVSVMARV
eukprot:NODE_9357_length_321_cov_51.580882_g7590_i0.p3 GENE.NODE_9357_length_321_cov_51.580882_g7590_i0~~NODE_9357_length_321_cov_51.580882_g7590_i0.p3  ORF type:complete len:55 (+),score=14.67 NODE_9357_length_321_cov_51.580882_g7590_i0:28-192(+)